MQKVLCIEILTERDGQAVMYKRWLGSIPVVSAAKKIALEEQVGEAKEIYRMDKSKLEKIKFLTKAECEILIEYQKNDVRKQQETQLEKGISFAAFGEKEYPSRLKNIYQAPYGLFYRGTLPQEEKCAVAIVGARVCSEYGRNVAKQIGYVLGKLEVELLSGMAAGIDGAAQWGALKAQGKTYGVLGCGVDICYPKQNQSLYEKIPQSGGIISEYSPQTTPRPIFFPNRNRIISGMADIVIIVEARKKSGSLITADFALEQGKEIYAVPGRVGDKLSEGTNRLIQQGAEIFTNVQDMLQNVKKLTVQQENSAKKTGKTLEKLERLVYSCVDLTPRSLEMLMENTGLPLGELVTTLNTLREKGCILEVYKNYFVRTEIMV